jgi:ABC-type dipeptide/oligopeptide/nickel transport system permease subunit
MSHNHHEPDHYDDHSHQSHESSILSEIGCHLPWATFSIAFGFILLSILHFIGLNLSRSLASHGYHILFHSFHYLHIVYAVVGTMVTFSRFSSALGRGIILSIVSPTFFCTLSDVALPTLAGNLLGVKMDMHICFSSELHNIVPLLLMGLITGLVLRVHHESSLSFFSLGSHFVHILISSLASLFYMVSYGFDQWHESMGLLFFFLVIAVVVPCTLSDVVVPWYFARRKHEKHKN